jgi:hypothetical protein
VCRAQSRPFCWDILDQLADKIRYNCRDARLSKLYSAICIASPEAVPDTEHICTHITVPMIQQAFSEPGNTTEFATRLCGYVFEVSDKSGTRPSHAHHTSIIHLSHMSHAHHTHNPHHHSSQSHNPTIPQSTAHSIHPSHTHIHTFPYFFLNRLKEI